MRRAFLVLLRKSNPKSRNTQIAAELGVSSGEIMNFSIISEVFKTRSKKLIEAKCNEILKINDMSELKELSTHLNEFVTLLAEYKRENIDSSHYANYIPNVTANILTQIKFGNCRCKIYTSSTNFDIHVEVKNSFVTVFEENEGHEYLYATYKCKCNFCNNSFFVEEGDSGHTVRCTWHRLS